MDIENLIDADVKLKAAADSLNASAVAAELAKSPEFTKQLIRRRIVQRYGAAMDALEAGQISTWKEARQFLGAE